MRREGKRSPSKAPLPHVLHEFLILGLTLLRYSWIQTQSLQESTVFASYVVSFRAASALCDSLSPDLSRFWTGLLFLYLPFDALRESQVVSGYPPVSEYLVNIRVMDRAGFEPAGTRSIFAAQNGIII